MNDPLGFISNNPAARASGPAKPIQADGPDSANAQSFRDLMVKNLERVNQLQEDASAAIEDLNTGKRDDLETVLMATQKADTAFRMLLQVRNQVMNAYDEIKQIRV